MYRTDFWRKGELFMSGPSTIQNAHNTTQLKLSDPWYYSIYVSIEKTITHLSLHAPFHSHSFPQGLRILTIGILPDVLDVWMDIWKEAKFAQLFKESVSIIQIR